MVNSSTHSPVPPLPAPATPGGKRGPPPPLPSLAGPKKTPSTPSRSNPASSTSSAASSSPIRIPVNNTVMPPFTPPNTVAVGVENPTDHDVLCGRGVTTNRHKGNEKFRGFVSQNKELYVSSTKKQKMTISRSIVETVRNLDPPGRFLEKDPNTGLWFDIGDKKAVEKTSQALRDGAACLRKQLTVDTSDSNFLNAVFDEKGKPPKSSAKKKGKGHRRTNSLPSNVVSSLSSSGTSANSAPAKSATHSSSSSTSSKGKSEPPALKKQRSTNIGSIVTSASFDVADSAYKRPTLSPRFSTNSPRASPPFSASANTSSKHKKRGHKRTQSANAIPSLYPPQSPTPNLANPMHYSPQPYGHHYHHPPSWHGRHGPPPSPQSYPSSPHPYAPPSPQPYAPPPQPFLPTSPVSPYPPPPPGPPGQDQLSPLPYSHRPPHHMYGQPQHSWSAPPSVPSLPHSSGYGQHGQHGPPPIQPSYSQGAPPAYHPVPPSSAPPLPTAPGRLMPTPSPIHISPPNQSSGDPSKGAGHQQHFFPSSAPPPPTTSHVPPSPSQHPMSPPPPPQITSAPPPSSAPPVPSLHPNPTHNSPHQQQQQQRAAPPTLPDDVLLDTSFSQSENSAISNPNLIDSENIEQNNRVSSPIRDIFMKLESPPRKSNRQELTVIDHKAEPVGSFDEFPSPLPYDEPQSLEEEKESPLNKSMTLRSESPTLLFGSLSEHILSLPLDSPPRSPERRNPGGGDIFRGVGGGTTAKTSMESNMIEVRREGGRNQEHVRQVSDPPVPPFDNA